MVVECSQCGESFVAGGLRGFTPRHCSTRCRKRAQRARDRVCPLPVDGRWVRAVGKRPVMVDGAPASSTDSSTWCSWAEVRRGAGDGFGVMLGGGLGCYDLDGCLDAGGVLDDATASYIASIPEPVLFVERSVSGRGLHVFVEATEGRGSRRGGVERYTRERFIRMTGDAYDLAA